MNNYDLLVRLQSLEKTQIILLKKIETLLSEVKPEKELLDNSDMMRMFRMSERTLAYMRSRNEIEYVKIKGKIYYPKESVDQLLTANSSSRTNSIISNN